MIDEAVIHDHALRLKAIIATTMKSKPRRFVLLTDVFQYYHDDDELAKALSVGKVALIRSIIDYEAGVIFDPWASVIKLNCDGIHIYESTLSGLKQVNTLKLLRTRE